MLSIPHSAEDRGHCKACRWWHGEHDALVEDTAIGLCMHPELTHFSVQVSGLSSCNRYELEVLEGAFLTPGGNS